MSLCVLQVGLMASPLRFDGRVVLVTGAGGGEHAKAGGHALPGVAAWEQLPSGLSMGLRAAGWGREEAAWGARGRTRWDGGRGRTTAVVRTPSLLWRERWGWRSCVGSHGLLPTRSAATPSPTRPVQPPVGPRVNARREAGLGCGLQNEVKVLTELLSAHQGRLFLP